MTSPWSSSAGPDGSIIATGLRCRCGCTPPRLASEVVPGCSCWVVQRHSSAQPLPAELDHPGVRSDQQQWSDRVVVEQSDRTLLVVVQLHPLLEHTARAVGPQVQLGDQLQLLVPQGDHDVFAVVVVVTFDLVEHQAGAQRAVRVGDPQRRREVRIARPEHGERLGIPERIELDRSGVPLGTEPHLVQRAQPVDRPGQAPSAGVDPDHRPLLVRRCGGVRIVVHHLSLVQLNRGVLRRRCRYGEIDPGADHATSSSSRSRTGTRRLALLPTALVAAALLLGACGSSTQVQATSAPRGQIAQGSSAPAAELLSAAAERSSARSLTMTTTMRSGTQVFAEVQARTNADGTQVAVTTDMSGLGAFEVRMVDGTYFMQMPVRAGSRSIWAMRRAVLRRSGRPGGTGSSRTVRRAARPVERGRRGRS